LGSIWKLNLSVIEELIPWMDVQNIYKGIPGLQDITGLGQIGLDTCTLLWPVFRLSEVFKLP